MLKVILCCSTGMSTRFLVAKMEDAARKQGIDIQIQAISEADIKKYEDEMNILLLGPQVRFMLPKLKSKYEPMGIPVEVIPTLDYGTMNGAKILAQALNLTKK